MRRFLMLMCAIVCLMIPAYSVWAADASFYDASIDKIVRAYYESGAVKIEVRNAADPYERNQSYLITCPGYQTPANPQTVATGVTVGDVSLAYVESSRTGYVVYTQSTLKIAACVINAQSPTPTYAVSGRVALATGSGLQGVTVSAGGKSTTSGADGTYAISGLPAGSYTVTPSLSGYTFSPTSQPVTISSANVTGINFTATASGGSSGLPNLRITGVTVIDYPANNARWRVSITIKNEGDAAAGAFTVKGYWSKDDQIGPLGGYPNDTVVFTWNVSGLGAGQTASNTVFATFSAYPIHNFYYFIVKVDADNAIAESNEADNTRSMQYKLTRSE